MTGDERARVRQQFVGIGLAHEPPRWIVPLVREARTDGCPDAHIGCCLHEPFDPGASGVDDAGDSGPQHRNHDRSKDGVRHLERDGHADQLGDHRQDLLDLACARERPGCHRLLVRAAGSEKSREVDVAVNEARGHYMAGCIDVARRLPRLADVSLVADGDDDTGADRDRGVDIGACLGREVEHSAADDEQIAWLRVSRGAVQVSVGCARFCGHRSIHGSPDCDR